MTERGQQIAGYVGMILTKLGVNATAEDFGKIVGFLYYQVVEAVGIELLTAGGATPAILSKLAGTLEKSAAKLAALTGKSLPEIKAIIQLLRGPADAIAATVKAFCFAEGTVLLGPDGMKPIEEFAVGDAILSADEHNPTCCVEVRYVEATYKRSTLLIRLRVGGQEICLTPDHPIFVPGRGWVQAGILEPGDRVLGHDGRTVAVDAIEADGALCERYIISPLASSIHSLSAGRNGAFRSGCTT